MSMRIKQKDFKSTRNGSAPEDGPSNLAIQQKALLDLPFRLHAESGRHPQESVAIERPSGPSCTPIGAWQITDSRPIKPSIHQRQARAVLRQLAEMIEGSVERVRVEAGAPRHPGTTP